MCDKKNKVLFIDSECLVLSPEFKLPDENKVLLKIPRQNNMYSFNLENIVPSGGLACLIAKATINRHKNWLVHKQTTYGKDFSNPFMVENLPKIVGFSTHFTSLVKSWLVQDQTVLALASPKANELTIPEQTATGKGTSNPLMAGSLPKTTKPT
ncbi:hypothetical protein Tco_0663614 [Tanacetum coccineum]